MLNKCLTQPWDTLVQKSPPHNSKTHMNPVWKPLSQNLLLPPMWVRKTEQNMKRLSQWSDSEQKLRPPHFQEDRWLFYLAASFLKQSKITLSSTEGIGRERTGVVEKAGLSGSCAPSCLPVIWTISLTHTVSCWTSEGTVSVYKSPFQEWRCSKQDEML